MQQQGNNDKRELVAGFYVGVELEFDCSCLGDCVCDRHCC